MKSSEQYFRQKLKEIDNKAFCLMIAIFSVISLIIVIDYKHKKTIIKQQEQINYLIDMQYKQSESMLILSKKYEN